LAPTVGIVVTRFCYPGGILQVFIDKISKFRGCQEQQSDRFNFVNNIMIDWSDPSKKFASATHPIGKTSRQEFRGRSSDPTIYVFAYSSLWIKKEEETLRQGK
jgi:hypothetical protein